MEAAVERAWREDVRCRRASMAVAPLVERTGAMANV